MELQRTDERLWGYGAVVSTWTAASKTKSVPHTKEQKRAIRKKQIKEFFKRAGMSLLFVVSVSIAIYSFINLFWMVGASYG